MLEQLDLDIYVCMHIHGTSTAERAADMEHIFSDTICSNILDVCTHALHLMCGKMAEQGDSKGERELKDRGAASVRMRDVRCLGRREPWGFMCCAPKEYLFINNYYVTCHRAERKIQSLSFILHAIGK